MLILFERFHTIEDGLLMKHVTQTDWVCQEKTAWTLKQ